MMIYLYIISVIIIVDQHPLKQGLKLKRAALSDYFTENGYVKLITGDGQVCDISLDPLTKD